MKKLKLQIKNLLKKYFIEILHASLHIDPFSYKFMFTNFQKICLLLTTMLYFIFQNKKTILLYLFWYPLPMEEITAERKGPTFAFYAKRNEDTWKKEIRQTG